MRIASADFEHAMAPGTNALAARRALFGKPAATLAQCLDLVAAIYAQAHGVNSVARLMTLANLGRVYYKMGNYAKAEPVLLEWHQLLTTAPQPDEDMIARARDCLRQLYEDWEKPGEAAKWQ